MTNLSKLLFCCLVLVFEQAQAQMPELSFLDSGRKVSIRGLSVASDKVIWCGGSKGSVARSIDGGKSFAWQTIPGYEQRDFRDVYAFDGQTALVMGIAEPAVILKTTDGGKSWLKVFEDSTKGMFLDAMDFDRKGKGVVIGDPIDGNLFRAFTSDYGDTWVRDNKGIRLQDGEAFFASSGTNIQATGNRSHPYLFVSGGVQSNLYYKETMYSLPLLKGKESTGANSIAVHGRKAIVVGGDFKEIKDSNGNCVLIDLGKEPSMSKPISAPKGYKSCVIYRSKKIWISCGTSGVDVSFDGGMNCKPVSAQGFHVVQKSRKGKAVFLAGPNGKIARLQFP